MDLGITNIFIFYLRSWLILFIAISQPSFDHRLTLAIYLTSYWCRPDQKSLIFATEQKSWIFFWKPPHELKCDKISRFVKYLSFGAKFQNITRTRPEYIVIHTRLEFFSSKKNRTPSGPTPFHTSVCTQWFCNLSELHVFGGIQYSFLLQEVIWSPIDVAAHSVLSLANGRFPGQPHAHWECVQGQGHCVA